MLIKTSWMHSFPLPSFPWLWMVDVTAVNCRVWPFHVTIILAFLPKIRCHGNSLCSLENSDSILEFADQKWGSSIDFNSRPYNRPALPCCMWLHHVTVITWRDNQQLVSNNSTQCLMCKFVVSLRILPPYQTPQHLMTISLQPGSGSFVMHTMQ